MNWAEHIDIYCERLGPGLWAEPVNALTNLSFIAAAAFFLRAARRDPALRLLGWEMAAIGAGSFVFHTVATRWGAFFDSGFIALYMASFAAVWAQRVRALPWSRAWLGAPVFVGFVALTTLGLIALRLAWLPPDVTLYVAAWLALLAFVLLSRGHRDVQQWLLGTLGVFTVSLTMRQVDQPLCAAWPVGTHFGWHLLNGLAVWMSGRALLVARSS
jgi:hypothetical protein